MEKGCSVTGVDNSSPKIDGASEIFSNIHIHGTPKLITCDFFDMQEPPDDEKYDVVIVHDVIEHIHDKTTFVIHVKKFVKERGVIFWAFPAWQMPFGGHQQLCNGKICSILPYIHLLPTALYRSILKAFGQTSGLINALIDIKQCKTSIEHFEKICNQNGIMISDRCLWFINPHYKQKFNLRPRKLFTFLANIRYVRNFLSTSCFYLTKNKY